MNEPAGIRVTWLHRLASWVGTGYLRFVAVTSFVKKWDHPSFLEYRRKKLPLIYAFWHNTQVFLTQAHRNEHVNVMVSRSKDGEYIAQVMIRSGLTPIRGSSSRGGEQAMLQMLDRLKAGEQAGFTPDGPRGPLHTVHGGVVAASQKSGAPVIGISVASRRKIVFNSWDRFFVPLPFGQIVVAHGKPFVVPASMETEPAKKLVHDELMRVTALADRGLELEPSWRVSFVGEAMSAVYRLLAGALLPVWFPVVVRRYGWKRSVKDFGERLGRVRISAAPSRRLWLHAASVGEWQALKPLVDALGDRKSLDLVVTTSTPEAKKLVQLERPSVAAQLIPFDFQWIQKSWLRQLKPDAVLLVETEIWPCMIDQIHRHDIPLYLINGRLSARSARGWRYARPLSRRLMAKFSHVFPRTNADAEGFLALGSAPERLTVTGNMKYDSWRVLSDEQKQELRHRLFGDGPGFIVTAGSTWPGEEEHALKIFEEKLDRTLKLVLAPRRLSRVPEVTRLLESSGRRWIRWGDRHGKDISGVDVILVDTMGELNNFYGASDAAFVGGSVYPKGGQNPLEPAAARVPPVFGPSMENFSEEAKALVGAGAALQAADGPEVCRRLGELLRDSAARQKMGEAAAGVVMAHQGATQRILRHLEDQLEWLRK